MTSSQPVVLGGLELPREDGIPMESAWHVANMNLLIEVLRYHWRDRDDYFCGGNMFVYYSREQAEQVVDEVARDVVPPPETRAYRGPDFFVVLGVDGTVLRETWVVWEEGGRYPNVIVELQSPSTAAYDEGRKKDLYEQVFRTTDYFCVDHGTGEIKGWRLSEGRYRRLQPNERGWLWCGELGLWLGWWEGRYQGRPDRWARFYAEDGAPVPTWGEGETQIAQAEARRAEAEARRANAAAKRAEAEAQRAEAAERELARLRSLLAELGMDADQLSGGGSDPVEEA